LTSFGVSIEEIPVSQDNVERVIGKLATDETLRRRFVVDPESTLGGLEREGFRLSDCERRSLCRMDPSAVDRFADALDPRLQKTDLGGGERCDG